MPNISELVKILEMNFQVNIHVFFAVQLVPIV